MKTSKHMRVQTLYQEEMKIIQRVILYMKNSVSLDDIVTVCNHLPSFMFGNKYGSLSLDLLTGNL